jgi:hypothetical protein
LESDVPYILNIHKAYIGQRSAVVLTSLASC